MPSPAGRFWPWVMVSAMWWAGMGWVSVASRETAVGPASLKRKTRSALPPDAKTVPSGVMATPMNRLAAGVTVEVSVLVSTVVRACMPPLSDETTIWDPSGDTAAPNGNRHTSTCDPAGPIFQPLGIVPWVWSARAKWTSPAPMATTVASARNGVRKRRI